jgi:nucleoside 2-deoxyribosyltransferase
VSDRKRIYLASPLGFADSTRGFMAELAQRLSEVVTVVNPWDDTSFGPLLHRAQALTNAAERKAAFHEMNLHIGAKNEAMIRSVEMVVGVLDGVDVDSGTAAEMGFAYGLGMPVHGLRTDFRVTGDNEASGVNLQLRYFIERSGGSYHTSVDSLIEALRAR